MNQSSFRVVPQLQWLIPAIVEMTLWTFRLLDTDALSLPIVTEESVTMKLVVNSIMLQAAVLTMVSDGLG